MILDDVSIAVNGSERVGIAGRTGSGKSSLMLALFRINPLLKVITRPSIRLSCDARLTDRPQGEILIDGVDTSGVPLSLLRRRLGIIPQEPFMFTSTLRYNLDPFQQYADPRLWEALELVGLRQAVEKVPPSPSLAGRRLTCPLLRTARQGAVRGGARGRREPVHGAAAARSASATLP